jgi:diaminopimelate decarboxylase
LNPHPGAPPCPASSQAIRDYLAKNGGASVGEIKEALAKKGIKASDSLINAVRYRRARLRGRRRGYRAKAAVEGISVDSLVAAKQLVERAGSAEAAVQAIGVLRRLQG